MLAYEQAFWTAHAGARLAGIDEAGRGPLAGPVVAAAVVISPAAAARYFAGPLAQLTDSKQLTAARREHFFDFLSSASDVWFGVGWSNVAEIDDMNILVATHLAMRRAVLDLPFAPDHALVDGLPVKNLPCASTAIVKGDGQSLLIAAASVVAKVLRDHRMVDLDTRYPAYGFAANKGYGTHDHVAALMRSGPCPEHRRSFRPVQDAEQMLPGLTCRTAQP
jgi:ribonuclease HII